MKSLLTLLFLALTQALIAQDQFDRIFVDQNWLQQHQDDKNLVLLHVAGPDNYTKGHLKNAQLIVPDEYAEARGDLYWELPDTEKLEATLRAKGITNETVNVLYYGGELFAPAFRLYFTLDYLGLGDNTYILDGGLPGWLAKELPVTTAVAKVIPTPLGKLNLQPNKNLLVQKEDVLDLSGQPSTCIIDARKPDYYSGEKDGRYRRSGHISNATNITWTDLVDENKFLKGKEDLKRYFTQAGVKDPQKVITYCHVGLRATVLYTIAKAFGHDVQLYDGSFNEWDKLDDKYLVETGN